MPGAGNGKRAGRLLRCHGPGPAPRFTRMPAFIDSHCHLADPAFDADRDAVIERARVTGAVALVCIGESLDAARRARAIAARHP
ncbi:MAG: TatD family hydrolase, partial [Gemmatimonadaceae bacterium]